MSETHVTEERVEVRDTSATEERERRRRLPSFAITADTIELIGAVGGLVLAILALIGVVPRILLPLASVAIGVGLIGHGGVITKWLSTLRPPPAVSEERAKVGEAAGDEVLGGTAAITLGLVALVGFEPVLLLGVAAIASGGALVLASWARPELFHVVAAREHRGRRIAATAVLMVAGAAAAVLGIVAISGASHARALVEIAFVVISSGLCASALLTGSHLMSARHRRTPVDERLTPTAARATPP